MTFIETSFKIDSKSRIASLISGKKFRSDEEFFKALKRLEKEQYPKIYKETDEEGTWETLDFGPEGIDSKELLNYLKS